MTTILSMTDVSRTFDTAGGPLPILETVQLQLAAGDAVALRGSSGCGKTTLLHLAGTLDQPTSGLVEILGTNPWKLSVDALAEFRNLHIGFVFQEHQLLPQCNVLENTLLPLAAGFCADTQERRQKAEALLERVGLQDRLKHRPSMLSGGERQRVAVCRALLMDPELLLADEPTGNLDPETGQQVGHLLLEMAAETNTALLCVTHSDTLAEQFPVSVNVVNRRVQFPAT